MRKRVVVTGTGVISPVGNDSKTFWKSIKQGKSGIKRVEKFDVSDFPTKVAGTVNFDPHDYMDRREARRMDRYSQYAIAAALQAMESAKLDTSKTNTKRMGVIVGSGIGGIGSLEKQHNRFMKRGFKRVSPFLLTMMIADSAAGLIAIKLGAKGINQSIVNSCATSTNAIGDAFRTVRDGYADVVVTGGSEASITPLSFAAFCAAGRAMSTCEDPKKASRPFDKNRDGFVMGEGAGILILESLDHALKRDANIIAEIAGYGSTCDAYHITAPDPKARGCIQCMREAMDDANVKESQIDYINAHGTSTILNDKTESFAIRQIFKEHADTIPVSSTKSMTGHLLGATGAVEALITALAVKNDFVPPTINYETYDPECELKDYVPNKGRKKTVGYAMTNGFGFGGHNASLVIKKYK